jgi:hypothetical protein
MFSSETPLIHTSRGNLPIDSLQYATIWEDTADYTKLIETYSQDGEIVRKSVHIFGRKPLLLGAEQHNLGL